MLESIGNKLPVIELDWRAYFFAFSQLHGGDPVLHRGTLLFRDGWRYARKDYKGPEFAPPQDPEELRELRLIYWQKRRAIVSQQLLTLSQMVLDYRQMRTQWSAPLQEIVRTRNEDGHVQVVKQDLDLAPYEARIKWLEDDVLQCNMEIQANQPQVARPSDPNNSSASSTVTSSTELDI